MQDATSSQISTGNNDGNWNYGYGYQFWRSSFGYRADGSLGQFVFVLPEQDAVLIITSATNDTDQIMNIVWDNLMPAFGDNALQDNLTDREALGSRLEGLALPTPSGAATTGTAQQISRSRFATQQNNQGIVGIAFDFDVANPIVTIEDADGSHEFVIGIGQWVRGRTGFKKRINELFDTAEQGVSAIGAWTDETTFATRLSFHETPYILDAQFQFNGDQLVANMGYNIRWGSTTEPQIVGSR